MTKVGHVIVGVSGALLLGFDPFLCTVGSIAPDKDILIARFRGTWNTKKRRTLLNSHRGITHHFYFLILCLCLILYLQKSLPYGYFISSFCLGYALHLIGDILTPLGIPYTSKYYPRLSVPVFRTNSPLEHLVVGVIMVVSGALIVKNPHLLYLSVSPYLQLFKMKIELLFSHYI